MLFKSLPEQLINIMDVTKQPMRGLRGRKRDHAAQDALDTPHILAKRPRSTCKCCTKHVDKKYKRKNLWL